VSTHAVTFRSTNAVASESPLGPVPTAALRVRYEAENAVYFPTAPAGIWRGQLGAALRRAAQAQSGTGTSAYEQLFRTPRTAVRIPDRPPRILGPVGLAGEHVPHPFVLRMAQGRDRTAPVRLGPGEATAWHLGLVGTAIDHLPSLTAALDGLGQGGIGRAVSRGNGRERRGTLRLREASLQLGRVSLRLYDGRRWRLPETCSAALYEQTADLLELVPPASEEPPDDLRVLLETPVRIAHEGTLLNTPSSLTAGALAQACHRRWAALSLCYAPEPPATERLDAAFEQARGLGRTTQIREQALRPARRIRYSARQDRRLSRAGLQGTVWIGGPPGRLAQWRLWLRRAAPLHLGKSTAMGFGQLSVDA
jgi:hypothetical protein